MTEFIRPGDQDFEKILRDFGVPIQMGYDMYTGYYLPRTGVKLLHSIEGITRHGELQIRRVGSGRRRSVGILRTVKLIDFLNKNMHNEEYNYINTNIRRKSKSRRKSKRRKMKRRKYKNE